MGLIDASPVRHVEKPRAGRRDVVITPEEYAWILGQVKDEQFRDLLAVCWETGCRPRRSSPSRRTTSTSTAAAGSSRADEAKGKKPTESST